MATEFKRMKQLFDSTAGWAANNIVLLAGEIGLEDTGTEIKGKLGDGVNTYSALPYSIGSDVSGTVVQAMYGNSSGVLWSSEPGWVLVSEGTGLYRVSFPTSSSGPNMQSVTATITQGGSQTADEISIAELTVSDCLVTVRNSAGGAAGAGISIMRIPG